VDSGLQQGGVVLVGEVRCGAIRQTADRCSLPAASISRPAAAKAIGKRRAVQAAVMRL
jgi:hypothetical protein